MSEQTTSRRRRDGTALVWFVLISVCLHLVGGLGAASIPALWEASEPDAKSSESEPMSVTLRTMPESVDRESKLSTEEERTEAPSPDETKKPQQEKPDKKQTTPEPVEDRQRKTVDQSNNREVPEEADYLASDANQTDEQTQARETTTQRQRSASSQSPANENQERAKGGENPAAVASRQPRAPSRSRARDPSKPEPPPKPTEQPQREQPEETEQPQRDTSERPPVESTDKRDGDVEVSEGESVEQQREQIEQGPPMPTIRDYERMFGETSERTDEQRRDQSRGQGGPGHAMFKNIEKRRGQVKAALENYLTHIKPGNHTSVNARRSVYASYINRIHRKVHAQWGSGYLPRLDSRFGPGHPLSNSDLQTVLEIVVDASSGEVSDVNIVQSSGVTSYDAEAVMIAYNTGPHPNPPEEIISPDGQIYLHWNFWRDQRQCGTFGVSVYKRLEDGGEKKVSPTATGK